jgi:ABC-type polysaccharide/polyol phosphate export permease
VSGIQGKTPSPYPGTFWFIIRIVLTKMAANRNLLKNLVLKDLKHRYVGSVGGFLWSVVHPLVQLAVYSFAIEIVFKMKSTPDHDGGTNFPIFIFCGLLPWLLFSDTIMRSCVSITENTQLITKTIIPAEILPLAITVSNLVHHLIGLSILLTVLVVFFHLHLSVFFILLYMPMLLLFAQGLGWIVAGLQVFLRDTSQALQIVLFIWWWLTPLMYAVDTLPERFQRLVQLNPMATIVTGYRNSLLHLKQPEPAVIVIIFMTSVGVFLIGGYLFRQAKPAFPDVL